MPTIAEIREQYPQYKDLSDQALADGMHQKFYSDMPKEAFYGKIGFDPRTNYTAPDPASRPTSAEAQVPTFDPNRPQQAQAIRETITGSAPGTQADWFKKQQEIESTLRAQGRTDEQISQNPAWQEASKNLSRAVSAGASSMAISELAGTPIAAGLGAGARAAFKPVVGTVRDALGRQAAKSAGDILGEAKAGVRSLISDQEKITAERSALDKATAGRPTANIVGVQRPNIDTTKVVQARKSVSDAERELSEATTRLQSAQRNMSSMDKYAGNRRSEALVRTARRDLNKAQADVNRLTLTRDEAMTARKEAEAEHAAAIKEARARLRGEQATASQIRSRAAASDKKIISLRELSNELNAAKEPAQIASSARKIGDQLFRAGKLSDEQHTEYLRRVGDMVESAKTTAEARDRLLRVMKSAGLLGIGAAGGSFLIRTMH